MPQRSSSRTDAPATRQAHRAGNTESSNAEYSRLERLLLLGIARQAVSATLRGSHPEIDCPSEHLSEPRGVFTTLMFNGKLRGCVGQPFPVQPLWQAVASTAVSAAVRDPRFAPLTRADLECTNITISVLSPLFPIAIEEIVIGKHGLLISLGSRRGLLLPEVPVHMGWDVHTFLEQTCHKSGLAGDAWQHGATTEAFTTEVFSESD